MQYLTVSNNDLDHLTVALRKPDLKAHTHTPNFQRIGARIGVRVGKFQRRRTCGYVIASRRF